MNNSQIGILGEVTLDIEVGTTQKSNQEFYIANKMDCEIILGLDWSMNN